jgi:hypothetical protein
MIGISPRSPRGSTTEPAGQYPDPGALARGTTGEEFVGGQEWNRRGPALVQEVERPLLCNLRLRHLPRGLTAFELAIAARVSAEASQIGHATRE